MSIPVSVYIIALNEEANLRRLLPQLTSFLEVVIVDSGSQDLTADVARLFPNVRFMSREWTGFSAQKAYALSRCRCEWVLNLDADEELTPEYFAAMHEVVRGGEFDALESRRKLLRWGRAPITFMKDDVLIRLFRKDCGQYLPVKVHERIVIRGKIKHTDTYFLHHENLSYTQRIQKSNQYSQLKAEDKFANGSRCTILHLLLSFPVAFLACYLGKGCFLDGSAGVLTSMNHAYYNFMKYAKLWELNRLAAMSTANSPAIQRVGVTTNR